MHPSLSVLIVAWNSRAELSRTLPALLPELGPGDELIVVDNDSPDDSVALVRELAPAAKLVRMGRNVGFAGGCNAGAAEATGDLLVILNPDAAPQPGWGEAIRLPWLEGRGFAAWQALVAQAGVTEINSARNPVHFTGLVWSGGHGEPLANAPDGPTAVTSLSGACLAIPTATWRRVGGFAERFFMYHEDVDLAIRLQLQGGTAGIEPRAVVEHDYEFGSSAGHKWRWLERNRLAFLVRTYPAPLLLLLAPALLATELALFAVSARAGWGGQKLAANAEALRWLPRLLRERRQIQRERTVSAAEFAARLTPDLDSPFISAAARSLPARLALRTYWRAVRALLGPR
ncbi:MAG TPA: glycosyltransferase family 2 protein [Solirubrobacterales bacterium]